MGLRAALGDFGAFFFGGGQGRGGWGWIWGDLGGFRGVEFRVLGVWGSRFWERHPGFSKKRASGSGWEPRSPTLQQTGLMSDLCNARVTLCGESPFEDSAIRRRSKTVAAKK